MIFGCSSRPSLASSCSEIGVENVRPVAALVPVVHPLVRAARAATDARAIPRQASWFLCLAMAIRSPCLPVFLSTSTNESIFPPVPPPRARHHLGRQEHVTRGRRAALLGVERSDPAT